MRGHHSTCAVGAVLLAGLSGPCFAQAQPARTSEMIEREIAALQAEHRATKIAEAQAALQQAEAAAAEARQVLQSLEAPVQASRPVAAPQIASVDGASDDGEAEPDSEAPTPVEVTEKTTKEPDGTTVTEVTRTFQQRASEDDDGKQKFGGIEFGIGVAFSYDLGENDRIKEATLDPNGIVRVTDRENVAARFILESHYLFTPIAGPLDNLLGGVYGLGNTVDEKVWGYGPFIAVQPGDDEVISAIGAGLMVGFRRRGTESQSFNLGLGVLYDLNVRLLGEGLEANQPLPPGETEIRYLEEDQSGLLVMSSFSF